MPEISISYPSSSTVFRSENRYVKCLWKDLKVGDIVHLSCDEMIPADILLLRTSDPQGICYIDTRNLDGEANLKQREVPRGFSDKVSRGGYMPDLTRYRY